MQINWFLSTLSIDDENNANSGVQGSEVMLQYFTINGCGEDWSVSESLLDFSPYLKFFTFLRALKKGSYFSPARDRKLLSAARHLVNLWTSFRVLGDLISIIALIL